MECMRSSSMDCMRSHTRSANRSSYVTSFRWPHDARPVSGSCVEALLVAPLQSEQLPAHSIELADLGVDLSQPTCHQVLGVPARALSSIANVEELFDVRQPQAHAPRPADEAEALRRFLAVDAIAGGGPRWRGQKAKTLVITQRVSAEAQGCGLGRDCLRHRSER